jgi:hypothetical protein
MGVGALVGGLRSALDSVKSVWFKVAWLAWLKWARVQIALAHVPPYRVSFDGVLRRSHGDPVNSPVWS